MFRMGWLCCVVCCVALGTAWGAEYQVVDLGQYVRPEAISPEGDIAEFEVDPVDPVQHHFPWLRRADGTIVLGGRRGLFGGDTVHVTDLSGDLAVGWVGAGLCYPGCARAFTWTLQAGFQPLLGPWREPSGFNRTAGFVHALAGNGHGTIAGEISGNLLDRGNVTLPVAWVAGQGIVLGPDGTAQAVNAFGVIVGQQGGHATRWTSEGATRLDRPGTVGSIALAINDHGTIAGSLERTDGQQQAFVWLEGAGMQLLPLAPGDLESEGVGVDATDVVLGNSWNDFAARIVRWSAASGQVVVEDLQTLVEAPGWVLEAVTAVNASGAAVGMGTRNGVAHAFLLAPLPTGLAAR